MFLKYLFLLPLICPVMIHCDNVMASEEPKKIFCHYSPGSRRYLDFEMDMDPSLCTHMIYGNCGLLDIKELEDNDNWQSNCFEDAEDFNNLKQKSPSLKTLIWVGGWKSKSFNFSVLAADPMERATFLQLSIECLQKYNFNGLVIDWQYPNKYHELRNNDWENFAIWLKELSDGLKPHGFLLILTIDRPKNVYEYNISELVKQVDFLIIQLPEIYQSSKVVAITSPLYAGSADQNERDKQRNFNAVAQFWLRQGIPRHKIVMAITFYGRSFVLKNPQNHNVGAACTTCGAEYDNDNTFGYHRLCEMFKCKDSPWHLEWESKQMVPYAYRDTEWIGYENEKSVALKVDYVKKHNLGGVSIWSIDDDDFLGECGAQPYPLLRVVNNGLRGITIKSAKNKVQRSFKIYPVYSLILAILYYFLL